MLFSQVGGLPVRGPDGQAELTEVGVLRALTVDAASARVTHLRVRAGVFGKLVLPWPVLRSFGPEGVVVGSLHFPGPAPPHHDILHRRILTDAGDRYGTVLDVAFDQVTGRVEAVFTTLGEVSPRRLLGLGDYALVVLKG
ncbi:PRC-barrel domain-containing protein [Streptomyces sp. NPDC005925]|uniref:PRC-barrel domain-containing protein n=1 Tax=Streptomyces sp. NPDC005925 TaxID=3157172 RepID=UPI0033E240FD